MLDDLVATGKTRTTGKRAACLVTLPNNSHELEKAGLNAVQSGVTWQDNPVGNVKVHMC